MTKADLIAKISEETGLERNEVSRAVESMMEFINALNAAQDLIMANPDDYAQSPSWDRVKARLEKEASSNNYKGGIDIRPSASDGLLYVTYRPGHSGLQLLAGSVSFRRDNPLGK